MAHCQPAGTLCPSASFCTGASAGGNHTPALPPASAQNMPPTEHMLSDGTYIRRVLLEKTEAVLLLCGMSPAFCPHHRCRSDSPERHVYLSQGVAESGSHTCGNTLVGSRREKSKNSMKPVCLKGEQVALQTFSFVQTSQR